nr:putative Ig domain-containing protein [Nostoc sp. ChiSLP01]
MTGKVVLDTTFNTTGKVTTDFNGNDEAGNSVAVQDDGKVLVAGYSNNGTNDDFAIARYNSDGTLDTTFNTTGKFTSDFNGKDEGGNSIIVQDDDKILVAGVSNNGTDYDFALARYMVNQSPEVANEIQDIEATEDSVFNFTIPEDTFSDADAEDILTYTATLENDELLPTWLNFNPDTLTFSGTPTNKDVGSLNIKVTATDIAGDEASDVFKLAVEQKADLTIVPVTLLTIIKGDVFSVKTKLNIKGDKGKLSIKIKTKSSNKVEELCVFNVDDDEGKIDGKAPGTEGYAKAALLRSKVIFCSLGNLPDGFSTADLTSILQFDSDTKLRFYMVSNSTTQDVLSGKASLSSVIFSSSTSSNSESSENGGFSLNFQSLVVTVEATNQQITLGTGLQGKKEGELLDLRDVKQSVKADFKVHREAALNNCVGFYQVADESGGIDTNNDGVADLLVGQAGYAEAAVRARITGIDLTVTNQGKASHNGTFAASSLFAPFIIVNGKPDAFVDKNSNNNPTVYFAFLGANTDKTDHIRLLGNNTFGFEDLASGGDKDYNDIIVKIDLTVNAV